MSKVEIALAETDADDDPEGLLHEYMREIDDDITEAILATGQYAVVADGDSQSWVIYKRKVGVEA